MIVYYLSNKNTPNIPFYIGITQNPNRRYKQHKNNYKQHKPYVDSKEDILFSIVCNTSSNKYSNILAEHIETNLIKYYDTVNYGSNECYVNFYSYEDLHSPINKRKYLMKLKRRKDEKLHRKFKKIVSVVKKDPLFYSLTELIEMSGFKNENELNSFMYEKYCMSFEEWLGLFYKNWVKKLNIKLYSNVNLDIVYWKNKK